MVSKAPRTVHVIFSKKNKSFIYRDIVIIKGGFKVKPELASLIADGLPKRLVTDKEYYLRVFRDTEKCGYIIYVIHIAK